MYCIRDIHCVRGQGSEAFHVYLPSLRLRPAETIAITGPSGSGKSTLLEVLGLVLRPASCRRFVWQDEHGDYDIDRLWRQRQANRVLADLRARRIGFVLQTGGLLPYLSVDANIALARRIAGYAENRPWLDHLIQTLKLGELRKKLPRQLSVGERQRVSIARAMAHEPVLLLADEPTAALDPELSDQVIDLMLALVARSGTSTVIVTHDHDWVRGRVDREIRGESFHRDGARGCVFT